MDFDSLMQAVTAANGGVSLPDEAQALIANHVATIITTLNAGYDRATALYEKRIVEVREQTLAEAGQHVFHHNESVKPRITLDVEKNTKGYNYSAHVSDCASPNDAMALLKESITKLEAEYGTGANKVG